MNMHEADINMLASKWMQYKSEEKKAADLRREYEDMLIRAMRINESSEGTTTENAGVYRVKAVIRMNRTIDSEKLQEIAQENGLTDYLSTLFRWKPEINAREWQKTDASITNTLLHAVTTKPGRPSFSIEKIEE